MPRPSRAHRWAWVVRMGATQVQVCQRVGCGWLRMRVSRRWSYRNVFTMGPYRLLQRSPACSRGRVEAARAWRGRAAAGRAS